MTEKDFNFCLYDTTERKQKGLNLVETLQQSDIKFFKLYSKFNISPSLLESTPVLSAENILPDADSNTTSTDSADECLGLHG